MGETATFASPNPTFLQQLSSTLRPPHRAFLFLLHDGHVVASAVLFKYPSRVMTSDMQGLDHARARPLRAYFVMMHWVIREALKEGYDFVDFGPTTGQAKIDAGCHEYQLSGGGYARNGLLGWAMKHAAGKVSRLLAKKGTGREGKAGGGGRDADQLRDDDAEVASLHIGPLHSTIHVGPGRGQGKGGVSGQGGGRKVQFGSPMAAVQPQQPQPSDPATAASTDPSDALSPTSGRMPRVRQVEGQPSAPAKATAPAGKKRAQQPAFTPPAAVLVPSTAAAATSQPQPVDGEVAHLADQPEGAVVVTMTINEAKSAVPPPRKTSRTAAAVVTCAGGEDEQPFLQCEAAANAGENTAATAASAPPLNKNQQKKLAKAEQAWRRLEAQEARSTGQPASPPPTTAAPRRIVDKWTVVTRVVSEAVHVE